MEQAVAFLIAHGGLGMFIAAFLAGSILPFASEAVLLGLLALGTDSVELLVYATLGNSLAGLLNYYIGRIGNPDRAMRYLKVSPEKWEAGLTRVRRYGTWLGLLSWVPVVGDIFAVGLGYIRASLWRTVLTVSAGKFARYAVLVYSYQAMT